ncbi:citrate synthase [Halopenitus malekzadehii]|uniref:Citrate synthase n=1 Tax=Halopenitus malekzadehii TaxID=1267564 RepID=A0A1H6HP89_9EURY|nr:citrate synthase [Halopenitus malekzadehii]SEH37286.1 citrate synthase [Halopenitus malekzadehii]
MSNELERGLEGVLVAESDLSYIDGSDGTLLYRGYHIEDLATRADFEEVLYLLWHDELPTRAELETFTEKLTADQHVDDDVLTAVADMAAADADPMDALRTAVSLLPTYDPESDADTDDAAVGRRQGRRITAKIPTILAAFDRARRGKEPVEPDDDLGYAGNFLYMLTGTRPDDVAEETFDMAMTLHADHGLNASTFASMVIASTMADVYSSVIGGIGALSGPLHGGANEDVMEMLEEIDEAGADPVEWAKEARADGRRIPGYGHRVYQVKDPRANILESRLRDLSDASGDTTWLDYTTAIEGYLADEGLVEKGIAPNVDFYSGSVYDHLGIPTDMYTPIFAMARAGGWIAHILEYQSDNRLIRPRARYTGRTDADFVPIDER